jgi:hypothetical protein
VQGESLSIPADKLQPSTSYNALSADKIDEHLRHVAGVVEHFISILTDLKLQTIAKSDEIQYMRREMITVKAHSESRLGDIDNRLDVIDRGLAELKVRFHPLSLSQVLYRADSIPRCHRLVYLSIPPAPLRFHCL